MPLWFFIAICICSIDFRAFAARNGYQLEDSAEGALHVRHDGSGKNSLNITDWVCAVRQSCRDPLVSSFMTEHGLSCDGKTMVLNNESLCAELLPMNAEEDRDGRSMITRAEVQVSCESVMGKWWSLLMDGSDNISPSKDELIKKLDRELRHEPVVKWLLDMDSPTDSDLVPKFMDYVLKGCVEVVLNVFTGGKFTLPEGAGALTQVFGEVTSLTHPTTSMEATTYGRYFTGIEEATRRLQAFTSLQVGKNWVKEHPRFQEFRRYYGVDDAFLVNVNKEVDDVGGSGSVFIPHGRYLLKCETVDDWHSAVDWRAFHVRADNYFDYMMQNPESLLPRIFSAYYDDHFHGYNNAFCFVIQNWIPDTWSRKQGSWYAKRRGAALAFDFKGSVIYSKRGDTNNRLVRNHDREHVPGTQGVLKDLNFLSTMDITLPCDTRRLMLEQVAQDVDWLRQGMIMDYSLFLHVISVGATDSATLSAVCPRSDDVRDRMLEAFFQRDRGFLAVVPAWSQEMQVYSMGLIDTLQPYSLFKAIGTAYDRVLFPEQVGDLAMNNIPADEYAERFVSFLDRTTICALEPSEPNQERLFVRHASKNCRKYKLEKQEKAIKSEDPVNEFCEDVLKTMSGDPLKALAALSTEFTHEEVELARRDSNFEIASCSHQPKALYVLGPVSAKSNFLTSLKSFEFGIGDITKYLGHPFFKGRRAWYQDAVIIDPDSLNNQRRSLLKEISRLAREEECIVRTYSETYQPMIQKYADSLFNETLTTQGRCKRDLIIKEECEEFERCAKQMNMLKKDGYEVHVIGNIESWTTLMESSVEQGTGLEFRSDAKLAFAKTLATITPMIAMATGRCEVMDMTRVRDWRPPLLFNGESTFSQPCAGMDAYEPYTLPDQLATLDQELLAMADLSENQFEKAQAAQGVRDVDIMRQRLCEHVFIQGLSQKMVLRPFCMNGPASIRLESLGTQSKGGSSLFTGYRMAPHYDLGDDLPVPFNFVVKSIHRHELDSFRAYFTPATSASGYLTPFLAVWQDFGMNWGLMPDCLDTSMTGTTYDIKGVPTLRYFRYHGILRDPNWIADFSDKANDGNSQIGIAQDKYMDLMTRLASDLGQLEATAAVDYSLLVSVFDKVVESPPQGLGPTSMRKDVWPAIDFRKGGSLMGFLAGGIIDYLENTTSLRKDRPQVARDMSVTLHSSPGVYACRLLLFVATQMLAPCQWDSATQCARSGTFMGAGARQSAQDGCRRPQICVKYWDPLYASLFGEDSETVMARTRELSGCANWDKNHKSIREAIPILQDYVKGYMSKNRVKEHKTLKLCETPKGKVPTGLKVVNLDNMPEDRNQTVAALRAETRRNFTPQEFAAARQESGFDRMLCHQEEPIAIFILGPPSSGKSSVGSVQLQQLGIPLDHQRKPKAVTLDGDIWREHHAGYQRLVQWGMQQKTPCMFMDAADGLKDFTKPQKKKIFQDAVKDKCHILIPETCSSVDRCVDMVMKLKAKGYKVHVYAIMANKGKVFERGKMRQDTTGRFYNTETFDKCITAVLPVMAMANGMCELIDNSADRAPVGAGPQTYMRQECRQMDAFRTNDLWAARSHGYGQLEEGEILSLKTLRLNIQEITEVDEETFENDEDRQQKLLEALYKK